MFNFVLGYNHTSLVVWFNDILFKVNHSGLGYPCSLCDYVGKHRVLIKNHMKRHHSLGNYWLYTYSYWIVLDFAPSFWKKMQFVFVPCIQNL